MQSDVMNYCAVRLQCKEACCIIVRSGCSARRHAVLLCGQAAVQGGVLYYCAVMLQCKTAAINEIVFLMTQ